MKMNVARLWPFSRHNVELDRLKAFVHTINDLEQQAMALSENSLQGKTSEFRRRLAAGSGLDDLLPEAYAVVREAARRSSLQQRPYDVQVMGAVALHWGRIVEMQNGEGKTLTATMPLYLHALSGMGAHLITANDYLAKRDTQWMGPIYHSLGLSVGVVQSKSAFRFDPDFRAASDDFAKLRPVSRQEAYKADVLYASFDEIVFDYLRDNMVWDLSQCVQGERFYAIVDEADIVMLDLAITSVQISGGTESEHSDTYEHFANLVRLIPQEQVKVQDGNIKLTDNAVDMLERRLNVDELYTPENKELVYHLDLALKARFHYRRDDDYIVKNGEIIVIDQVRRRPLPGRRWGDGLHEALEAKEGLHHKEESSMLYGTITIQNYLRLYKHLAGMTGTAVTDKEEFKSVYNLGVVVIPTHRPIVRKDYDDVVFKTRSAKMRAVVREIKELNQAGQPVLVGCRTDDDSNLLSDLLIREGVDHTVLNGKNYEQEARIIAQAGQLGIITINTRMAGRGSDIVLGQGVRERGGLHIIGTERHESRRLDLQLRGRAGRQGDPGSSRFYISLEDDLMRRFGGDRVKEFMNWAQMDEDEPLEHKLLSKTIEQSQMRVEGYNLDTRKHLLAYDDEDNKQRIIIYNQRHRTLTELNLKPIIFELIKREIIETVAAYCSARERSEWNLPELLSTMRQILPLPVVLDANSWRSLSAQEIEEQLIVLADAAYNAKERQLGSDVMRQAERITILRAIDGLWVRHLNSLKELRTTIGLRSLEQHNPLAIYQKQAAEMFEQMRLSIQRQIVCDIYRVHVEPTPTSVNTSVDSHGAGEVQPQDPLGYVRRGVERMRTSSYQDAIEDFSRAIELNPRYAEAYHQRAHAFSNAGNHREALADFQKAVELEPESPLHYSCRAQYFLNDEQYQEALSDLDKVISLRPLNADDYRRRGVAHRELRHHENALTDFNKAAELQPDAADIYYGRGVTYRKMGCMEKAQNDLRTYLELAPDAPDRSEVEAWLEV